ncbi:nuclear transport factor 2 family protein [Georgenia sunbinii]|uniref:nuclear transport factor 2 family protein n=1 Tax=Georgenia sunbinii TaxID=3117728 RepID=UPI002F26C9A8
MTARHPTDDPDRREFQALLDDWADAIVADDADRIEQFAEPDWEIIGPDSGPAPSDGFLAVVRDGSLTHSQMAFEVLSVRREGTLAVVVSHGTNRGQWRGEPFSVDEWTTDVFVRRDGRWRCRLTALTPNYAAADTVPGG